MSNLFTLSILALIYCIYQIVQYRKNTNFRELVAWCVTKDNSLYRCNLRLRDYIHNAQNRLRIPDEYRIQSDEWNIVNEILCQYQSDLKEDYFCGKAYIIKSKYVIPGETYFMFSLSNYLDDHQCDREFLSYDMHKETLSYKSCGSWGSPLYDAKYRISDFSNIYHKLFYISLLYCQEDEIINPKHVEYWKCSNVKNILDSKEIQIGRH